MACTLSVEAVKSVENVEEICAVPGIDVKVPAPFDPSTSLKAPGQFETPDLRWEGMRSTRRRPMICLRAGLG